MENGSLKKSSSLKNEITSSYLEVDSNDQYLRKKTVAVKVIDGARVSITGLALLCGITILGMSANAISVYNSTRLEEAGWLSIWPAAFDLRPTIALLSGSCIVTMANIAGLLCSKVPHVSLASSLTAGEAHQLTASDPKQYTFPYTDDVRGAICGVCRRHDCHHLLLRHQLIDNC